MLLKNMLRNKSLLLINILFLSTLFACVGTNSSTSTESEFPQGPLLFKFKKTQAQLLSGQYHMHCCMEGGSQTDQIKKISLGFQIDRKLSRDEGRAIVIDCVNQIIKNVCASEDLKPYLLPQGFDKSNVKMVLFIHTQKKVYHPDISVFSYSDGEIRFSTHEQGQTKIGYYQSDYEPYDEAVAILEQQGRTDILLPSECSDIMSPSL